MNHLLLAEQIKRWETKTLNELYDIRETIIKKTEIAKDSHSVIRSLTETLDLLEGYIKKRTEKERKK